MKGKKDLARRIEVWTFTYYNFLAMYMDGLYVKNQATDENDHALGLLYWPVSEPVVRDEWKIRE